MNYQTKSWWERFDPTLTIEGEGDDTSGGGGDSGDSGGDYGADDSGSSDDGGTEQVDLSSTDPETILKFPKGHRLNDEQLQAVMAFNPKPKPKPVDPTVAKKVDPVKKPDQKVQDTKAKIDPKAPVWDAKVKRWRDATTKKIVPAPKGVQPPKEESQPQQLTPEVLAEAVAKALPKAEPAAPKEDDKSKTPGAFYAPDGPGAPLAIPDELAARIFSDNPAESRAGVETLANGIANVVMRDVIAMMQYVRNDVLAQVPVVAGRVTTQQQSAAGFYDRYPMLNKSALYPGIDQVGKQLAREWESRGVQWRGAHGGPSDDFMDAVAVAFGEATGISIQPAQNVGQSDPVVTKPKSAFFNRKSSARPPAASAAQNKSAEILGVIGSRG